MHFEFDFLKEKECIELLQGCENELCSSSNRISEISSELKGSQFLNSGILNTLDLIGSDLSEEARESKKLGDTFIKIANEYRKMDGEILNIKTATKIALDMTTEDEEAIIDIIKDFFNNILTDEQLLELFEKIESSPGFMTVIQQYIHNSEIWQNNMSKWVDENGYIYDQGLLYEMLYGDSYEFIEDLLFGEGGMNAGDNTCEVIATYNAMISLGWEPEINDFPEMLFYFSQNGMLLDGLFGTTPVAVEEFLIQQGYGTNMLVDGAINENTLNSMQEDYDTYIVTFYNDKNDITAGVHTVNISCNEEGKYYVLNGTSDEGDSLSELVDEYVYGNGGEPISVIGVR